MPSRRQSTIVQLIGANAILVIGIVQGLLLVPLYISILGVELYGYWITLGGIVGLLALADLGVTNIATQRGAKLAGSGDFSGFGKLAGSLVLWNFGASALILTGGAILVVALPTLFNVPTALRGALQFALGAAVLESFFLLWTCTIGILLFALQRPTVHMRSFIASSILGILVTVTLLNLDWGLIAIPLGGCVRALLPLPFNLKALSTEVRQQGFAPFGLPAKEILKQFFADALLLAPAQWLETMLAQIDSIVVLQFLGPVAVTMLEITKKAAAVAAPFIGRVSASFLPGLAHLHGAKQEGRLKHIIEKLQTGTLYAALVYFGMVCAANGAFVSLWTKPELFGGQFLTVLIALASVLYIFKSLLYNLARSRDEVRFTAMSSYAEFSLHLGFALILVGNWGTKGVLLGGILASVVGLMIQLKGLRLTSISPYSFLHLHTVACALILLAISICAALYLPSKISTWTELAAVTTAFLFTCFLVVIVCDSVIRRDIQSALRRLRT